MTRPQMPRFRALPAPAIALAFAAGLALTPGPARAQQQAAAADTVETSPRCRAPQFRQFDFWVGAWTVHGAESGKLAGDNEIRLVAGGCALLESWRGEGGGTGSSLSTYDADRGTWTQRWVGSGSTLWLEGGLEAGKMVLVGVAPRTTPNGTVLDRITWAPLGDGRVRQTWEISTDGGSTWKAAFDGLYAPAVGGTGGR